MCFRDDSFTVYAATKDLKIEIARKIIEPHRQIKVWHRQNLLSGHFLIVKAQLSQQYPS